MKRGEVWLINLDPTLGAEIRKQRPAVIVSDDRIGILPLKVIVPITDWKEHYAMAPWMVKLEPEGESSLQKVSAADTFQIRSLSQERFIQQIGTLSEESMRAIERALSLVLHLYE
jgi:mRNA interferase MazF